MDMWSQSPTHILVMGHRGLAARYPENTMLSFQKAAELGVDGIEMDLNRTSDGVLVVIHDTTVDRTTNGTGPVLNYTLQELRQLDAGAGERIPTFAEFLDWIRPTGLLLNLEIKDRRPLDVDEAVQMLRDAGMGERTVLTCWDADITTYAHERYGVRTQGFLKERATHYRKDTYAHYYSIGIGMEDLTRPLCEELRQLGIAPWAWCPDDEESARRVIDCGATLVTCNEPEPALRLYQSLGLHG